MRLESVSSVRPQSTDPPVLQGMASNLNKLLARNTTDSSSPLLQSESRLFGHLKCIKAMASKRSRPLLRDFDEAVTRVIGGCAPPFPFASAWEYYAVRPSRLSLAC